jgi:class 3 adenylate cyclase
MDRHEVPEATPQELADAHAKDVEVAGKHNVEFFTYWYDANDGVAFCLANAPSKGDMVEVHREAHGMVPSDIIEVSEDNVLRFLGKVHEPVDASEITSAFRTVMFTDIEGSTSLLDNLGVRPFMALLTEHDLITRRSLVAWSGREVKHTGDGFLASFDDVADGLRCALDINEAFAARAAESAESALRVRIGIDAGEPVDHNDDIFGTVVNMASRICDAAPSGGTLVSEAVHELGTRQGFTFGEGRPTILKGFSEPASLFEMLAPPVASR